MTLEEFMSKLVFDKKFAKSVARGLDERYRAKKKNLGVK